jgi:glucose/arabinose dehydrogenase
MRLLAAAGLALTATFALSTYGSAQPKRNEGSALRLRLVVSGLDDPTYLAVASGEPRNLYVVEQPGTVRLLVNGRLRATPFLDIRELVKSGGEQGLLSIAFHPGYARNHLFYVDYTDTNGDTRVVEYRARGGRTIESSARQLLFVKQPYANHNGGQLQFGPDGLLYVGMGDGGSGGDPENRAQNLAISLGKLLRTDPARPRWQIAGYGLRNPWRFSFDRANGDLYIADVGQGDWEEVDYRNRAQLGRRWNYGWPLYEGDHRYRDGPFSRVAPYVAPVAEYSHAGGNCSITGGYVYRGRAMPGFRGRYVYGDYCSGNVWSLRVSGGKAAGIRREPITVPALSSFGEDALGELYAVSSGGKIWKIT